MGVYGGRWINNGCLLRCCLLLDIWLLVLGLVLAWMQVNDLHHMEMSLPFPLPLQLLSPLLLVIQLYLP